MKLHSVTLGVVALGATAVSAAAANGLPVEKVYGVNLGSWLLSEPWMFPNEWLSMGGEICDDCSKCAAHEFGLVKKLGQDKADEVFAEHWSTWFTQESVDTIADANLNTVRIPLGYWIVEDLVDRSTEFYPRGGMQYLKEGLRMLKARGINVLLDLHALPGVASPNQMFAGRCTSDVQFYTEKNYDRALAWTSVMTTLIHSDPDFDTVFALEAINEPIMDANQTPGYGDYQKNFVKVVRQTEASLGIQCLDNGSSNFRGSAPTSAAINLALLKAAKSAEPTVAAALTQAAKIIPGILTQLGQPIVRVRRDLGVGIGDNGSNDMGEIAKGHGAGRGPLGAFGPVGASSRKRSESVSIPRSSLERHRSRRRRHHARGILGLHQQERTKGCLMTSFMNKGWQYNNPPNPADAAMGPQLYDAHLYFSFGGVAEANADSYMRTICNIDRVKTATTDNNRPLVFGEWSLATNFDASEQFMHDWADAQRYIYAGQAEGWIFWSFKIEPGSVYVRQWSYFDALKAGYFGNDPSKLTNPKVCERWLAKNVTST
ncbi:Glucan endo-1,6-beta-glucosidase B [Ceratobasidium theobromae]|uniref:Glucan endo-1,6-beta-glucosidase B n=1 Tax=Ceratobasidium theobromae TaxID=1582974 RepID=A0A5N5QBQ0_9AGAM|nr:Glucan endo-1,6-beta-glucosidase B [Ceratobasidium theobromae]